MLRILIAFGTRPEAIKFAPLIKRLNNAVILNTGQHTELLEPVLTFYNITPHYQLACQNVDLLFNFNCITIKTREVFRRETPDVVIVQGDTLTTFAVSFTAFLEKIPVIHLEAGLRSWDKFSPFPEEMFRIFTDDLADIYLVPTKRAFENLIKEGKRSDRIFIVGNTVIDAIYLALELIDFEEEYQKLAQLLGIGLDQLKESDKVLVTSHRRESFGDPLRRICRAIKRLSEEYPQVLFIWSLHKNPKVREIVLEEMINIPRNLILTEALTYPQTILLMKDAEVILTDSGGIQEEAPTFKKPVLVLRDVTERIESYEAGFSIIVGREEERIISEFRRVYKNYSLKMELAQKENPYGDGLATERILSLFECEEFIRFIKNYKKEGYKGRLDVCKTAVKEFNYHVNSYFGNSN